MIELTLPLPPSVNHYYGGNGNRRFIRPAGLAFRKAVADLVALVGGKPLEGRIAMTAEIYPANRIRQDLDNRSKALQDALTHAGLWLDDSQIDELTLIRREVIKGGQVKITVRETA